MSASLTDYEDVIHFGKHRDKTVGEVYEEDPSYLKWLMEETQHTDFDGDMQESIYEASAEATREHFRNQGPEEW